MNKKLLLLLMVFGFGAIHPMKSQTNNSLAFDGENDYIYIDKIFDSPKLTFQAWVKPSRVDADQAIVSNLNETNSCGIELHIGSDGRPVATIRSVSRGWIDVVAPKAVKVDTWVNLAVTYDGDSCRLYVNGEQVVSAYDHDFYWGVNPYIGSRQSYLLFQGDIDEVSIWERAISHSEIVKSLWSGLTGNEENLGAYYSFNEGVSEGDNTSISQLSYLPGNYEYSAGLYGFDLTDGNTTSNFVAGFDRVAVSESFKLSPTTLDMATALGSNASFTINSNTEWTLKNPASWLSADVTSGAGNATITLKTLNTSNVFRTAKLAITTLGGIKDTLVVNQENMSGDGSASNPYIINTLSQLERMAKNKTAYYRLGMDIDASATQTENGGSGFRPIGAPGDSAFVGNFNGGGHVISNLYINRPEESFIGLFGGVDKKCLIDSVGIVNCKITGMAYVGALVGCSYASYVHHSYSSGIIVSNSSNYIGGMVGSMDGGEISNSHSSCSVSGGEFYSGGLVGIFISGSTLTNCYATGDVSGKIFYVGGLAGSISSYSTITNSYATGNVSGAATPMGGLVGSCESKSSITNSYFTGSVKQQDNVNGIVGGFAGFLDGSNLTSCYNAGPVNGPNVKGTLVGKSSGVVEKCYTNKKIAGSYAMIGLNSGTCSDTSSLTTEQMKVASNLVNLGSFTSDWGIRKDSTYAALRAVNNAPFAFADRIQASVAIPFSDLLLNDYDYETIHKKLTGKVISQTVGTYSNNSFNFPSDVVAGDSMVIVYRVGEQLASGDTLWGNNTTAVLIYYIKTGISSLSNDSKVNVYPNPASDFININLPQTSVPVKIVLFSSYGSVISSVSTNDTQVSINISGLAPGSYFFKISSDKQTQTIPWVKK